MKKIKQLIKNLVWLSKNDISKDEPVKYVRHVRGTDLTRDEIEKWRERYRFYKEAYSVK